MSWTGALEGFARAVQALIQSFARLFERLTGHLAMRILASTHCYWLVFRKSDRCE